MPRALSVALLIVTVVAALVIERAERVRAYRVNHEGLYLVQIGLAAVAVLFVFQVGVLNNSIRQSLLWVLIFFVVYNGFRFLARNRSA